MLDTVEITTISVHTPIKILRVRYPPPNDKNWNRPRDPYFIFIENNMSKKPKPFTFVKQEKCTKRRPVLNLYDHT